MILQTLVRYYDEALNESVLSGWQQRKASYLLDIDSNGNMLNSSTPIDLNDLMPQPPKGKTGKSLKAAFLCDTGGYLFGIEDENDKVKNGNSKYMCSRALHLKLLENIQGEVATAIKAFFADSSPKKPPKGVVKGTVCVIAVKGLKAYEDEKVKAAWNEREVSGEIPNTIIDSVTGQRDIIARLHGNIKGLGKDSPSLVNVNKESFASYGKSTKDPAAFIGIQTEFKYVTALNSLIADKKHRKMLGESNIIYWAEKGDGEEENVFANIWSMKIEESSESILSTAIKAIKNGKPVQNCNINSKFHILTVSLQSKRIVVRNYYESTFGKVIQNIINHYECLKISDDDLSRLTPFHLLGNTTVKNGEKYGVPAANLSGQLLNAILTNTPYPITFYNAILIRVRAGEEINKTKAAIIKAVLIRNFNETEVTTVALNKQSDNVPYNLGRLFSVLEKLQKDSSEGKLNSTIRDKYFSSACANPASVFPTILKLSTHHSAKLDDEAFYEILKTNIIKKLDSENPFPNTLNLEDQGRFIVGYYHQTQELYTSKKNRKAEEQNNG